MNGIFPLNIVITYTLIFVAAYVLKLFVTSIFPDVQQ